MIILEAAMCRTGIKGILESGRNQINASCHSFGLIDDATPGCVERLISN